MLQRNWKCRACLDADKLNGLVEVEHFQALQALSRSSGEILGFAL